MLNSFLDIINQILPEPQASLLNGILFGVKTALPKDFYQALITTSTVHITALSGQNITILSQIVSRITLPLGRKISIWTTVTTIIVFVWFVGFEPTIVRAAIMGSIALLAVYFGKRNWSLLSLILAAAIMLLVNFDWSKTISFQLSFLATLGIILFSGFEPSPKKVTLFSEIKRELKLNLRTTLSAQILTIPLIFFYFRQISLISPLTNILIASLIAPIMALGFITAICGWLFLPLGQVVGWIVWVPLTLLILMVELTAKIPFAAIKF